MLTAYEIRRHCYFSHSYNRGQEICYKGKYQILIIEQDGEDAPISVIASVKGSGTSRYNTRVTISAEGDEIEDCYCDCPSYQQTECMCKHCVAIALAYQAEQKKNSVHKDPPSVSVEPTQKTSDRDFMHLLQHFQAADKENRDFKITGQVCLVPDFHLNYSGKLSMELQVGVKRMYVVKDIPGLLAAVEQHEKIQYGKNLEFVHTPDAFTPEARSWLEILRQILAVEQGIQDLATRSTSASSYSSIRSLPLGPYGLDLCLSHYLDIGVPLPGLNKTVVSGNPPLTLHIIGSEQGATITLETEELRLFPIFHYMYVMVKDTIYRCTEEFSKSMQPLFAYFGITPEPRYSSKRYMFMAPSDYRGFCRYVLPEIEPYVTVVTKDFPIEDYQPLPARIQLYLSMPESQKTLSVEATCSVLYGNNEFDLWDESATHKSLRNAEAEQRMKRLLTQYLPDSLVGLRCEGEEHVLTLIRDGIPQMQEMAELMIDQKILDIHVTPSPKITFGISLSNGLLTLRIDNDLPNPQEIIDVLQSFRLKKKYHRFKNGELLSLDGDTFQLLQEVSDGLQLTPTQLVRGEAEVPRYRASYLDEMAGRVSGHIQVNRDASFRRMMADLNSYQNSEYDVPPAIHATLRNYQVDGFRWLCTLARYGLGGILGDDMGLGKTLQVIAYFVQSQGKSLVVCPASLVYNWESEIQKFAHGLSTAVIVGTTEKRRELLQSASNADVVITSYDLLKRDAMLYEDLYFDSMVVDEAQYIKNSGTQAAKAVKSIRSKVRFALTGTPIENRLSDLWSIFDFIMPGYLYSYQKFREDVEKPISLGENSAVTVRLKAMISPFVLRRKKEDVLKDLPKRLEQTMYVSMTAQQEKLYKALENQLILKLSDTTDAAFQKEQIQILAELTRLRQVCCSPSLCYEGYEGGSGKIDLCMEMLNNAVESNHRVLVFSQFTTMLEQLIAAYGGEYLYLSGKNTKEQRKTMVEQFQRGEVPVFFISLKAGGTGLNLTAADTVIHVDPWWNVAAQNQATDRAHRIGQNQVVTIFKLMTRDTIEERILELQERKTQLAELVLSGDGVADTVLTRDVLLQILGKHGSDAAHLT